MEKLSKTEQACLDYIESVRTELYHVSQHGDSLALHTCDALETAIKHLETMFAIIQTTHK